MLLCYYAILHLSIAWDNFLFLYQKHLPQKEVFCRARKRRAEYAVSLLCLVCLWVGELAHHG